MLELGAQFFLAAARDNIRIYSHRYDIYYIRVCIAQENGKESTPRCSFTVVSFKGSIFTVLCRTIQSCGQFIPSSFISG
jgi:phage-related protein